MKALTGTRLLRLNVGAYQAIALYHGSIARDRPPGFVRNVPDDVVAEAFATAGMPPDKLTLTFTALAIDASSGVVLIDTGLGEGGRAGTGMLEANLAATGISAVDVTHVVISHFHGHHISNLRRKDELLILQAFG